MRLCAISTFGLRLMPASRMRPSPLTNTPASQASRMGNGEWGTGNEGWVREADVAAPPSASHDTDKEMSLDSSTQFVAIRENSCAAKAAFVTGGAMKPEGLAMSWTRRPAKPGRGEDTAAPSRHQATRRHAGFVVARSAREHILPSNLLVTTPHG